MNRIVIILIFCVMLILSCRSNSAFDLETATATSITVAVSPAPSMTLVSPTMLTQPPIKTVTPFPILSPEERKNIITGFMRTNGDCSIPCFWGISPYISDYTNSILFLKSLGHKGLEVTENLTQYYNVSYPIKDEISVVNIILYGKGEKVESIEVVADGLDNINISNLDWLAFRPEMIIKTYGVPSDIFVGFHEGPDGRISYKFLFSYNVDGINIMYDPIDTWVLPVHTLQACPLKQNNIRRFSIWLGETSKDFLDGMIRIEESSLLSKEEFSKLLAIKPDTWCFDLFYTDK